MSIGSALRFYALEKNRYVRLWRKIGKPSTQDWTEYLKRHGRFQSFGENCFIAPESIFTDPAYTLIGNNVRIAGAWVSGHDGSINMLNRAYGTKLDSVGPVIIKDDVFIGRGCTILPGVTIGPRVIIGAGSVVSKDVVPNSVVAGNPLRFIRSLDDHVAIIQKRTDDYPWNDIIKQREGGFDPKLEPELTRQRLKHFFG